MKRCFVILILVALTFSLTSCAKEVVWPTSELGKQIPIIEGAKGEIDYYSTSVSISLVNITKKQYDDYIAACISQGFTIETDKDETSFSAYNENGYELDVRFYSNGNVRINLEAPTPMVEIEWDKHEISEVLPAPKSNIGAFEVENDEGTTVIIGKITTEQYEEYRQLCINLGFTVDETGDDKEYSAYNEQGYKLSLSYTSGNREMRIELDNPIEFSKIEWPTVGIATIAPIPPSIMGSEINNYDWTYSVYINMTRDDYTDYVQKCIDAGFNKDISKYEDSFFADYSDDESIRVSYEGNDTVCISITGSINKDYSSYTKNPSKDEISDATHDNDKNESLIEEDDSTSENSEHIHSYADATCEEPKTCNICGATEGKAKGHSWRDATCSSPKKCDSCGKTSGTKLTHQYTNGTCSNCGAKDPEYVAEIIVWIPTNGGTKYHSRASCSNMKNPKQVTMKEAIELGFTPCGRCH